MRAASIPRRERHSIHLACGLCSSEADAWAPIGQPHRRPRGGPLSNRSRPRLPERRQRLVARLHSDVRSGGQRRHGRAGARAQERHVRAMRLVNH